jgi:hypothetical protein
VWSRLALIVALFFLAGCAHTAKREGGRASDYRQCGLFCAKIDACLGGEFSDEAKERLCEIARCESGCRARIRSAAGYEGAFQFDRATWQTVCGPIFEKRNLPQCQAIESRSDLCCASACTADIIAGGGISRWPNCGRN